MLCIFRLDTAKYMWPVEIKNIFSRIDFLNYAHGFRDDTGAFLYQDVNSVGKRSMKVIWIFLTFPIF